MSAKITVIVYILICFEVGILLLILPWTSYWEDNVFLYFITGKLNAPWVPTFLTSGYVKGAVTGLGALNIFAGLLDIFKFRDSVRTLTALSEPRDKATKSPGIESSQKSSLSLSDHQPPSVPPQV